MKIILRSILQISIITIAISFFGNTLSFAATQGTAGSTSTGTVDIFLVLGDVVQISDLDDFILDNWAGSGDLTDFDDICVYSNTAGGGYNVTARGSGAGFAFEVTDGVNDVAYNVAWNDEALTGGNSLTTNIALTGQSGASTTSVDCNSGANLTSRLTITFLEANLTAAPVSVYSGTLTLDVAPE